MATTKKSKKIYYKRVSISNNESTAQELIVDALKKGSNAELAANRRELINQDDDSCRLINHHKEFSGMYFGQLVFFESGKSQALITIDDTATEYSIDAITTAMVDSDRQSTSKREFIDSFLYFGVLDDHLVLLQSVSLTSREFEAHLHWLLGSLVGSIDTNSAVILKDKPSEETIDKVKKQHVKNISLGTPICTETEVGDSNPDDEDTLKLSATNEDRLSLRNDEIATKTENATDIKFIPRGMGADILRLLMDQEWFGSESLEESLDDANLQVKLEISYLRKTSKTGHKVLNNIASALRHMDDNDVAIELQGGGQIKGGELKLFGNISVKYINGLVDENDLYHQMHNWLVQKVNANEIENTSDD